MMSFISELPSRGMVESMGLTKSQLAALQIVSEYKLRRVKGGWQAPGSPMIRRETSAILGAKRLLIRGYRKGHFYLELTQSGQRTLDEARRFFRKSSFIDKRPH